jgi:glutamine amidotransferase
VILPGVGAFPKAMTRIRELGLDELVTERVAAGVPVLGICLGLQLLFSHSDEMGGADGLGVLEGDVTELRADGLKVPHIGWAHVERDGDSRLFDGLDAGTPFYFVHTYAARPEAEDIAATAGYGERFACAVERDNVYGVQFHPEKSSSAGLRLLANFTAICAGATTTA